MFTSQFFCILLTLFNQSLNFVKYFLVVQKIFNFMRAHLLIIAIFPQLLIPYWASPCLCLYHEMFELFFHSISEFCVSHQGHWIIWSWFLYSIREVSIVLLHVDIQQHLLKRLSFLWYVVLASMPKATLLELHGFIECLVLYSFDLLSGLFQSL